jgi:AcrR family transcriptional regulator
MSREPEDGPGPVSTPDTEPESDASARRRGRRPAGEDTRGLILQAARTEFSRQGYDAVTLRGIARAAGVDARLVHHYFHGKEEIFVAAMDFPLRPSQVIPATIDGGTKGIGERVARLFLSAWESEEGATRVGALLGAGLSNPQIARVLREFLSREILTRVVAGIGGDDPELRGVLVASQMMGVAVTRYVVKIEPIASLDVEDLIPILAPTLERFILGDLNPGSDTVEI